MVLELYEEQASLLYHKSTCQSKSFILADSFFDIYTTLSLIECDYFIDCNQVFVSENESSSAASSKKRRYADVADEHSLGNSHDAVAEREDVLDALTHQLLKIESTIEQLELSINRKQSLAACLVRKLQHFESHIDRHAAASNSDIISALHKPFFGSEASDKLPQARSPVSSDDLQSKSSHPLVVEDYIYKPLPSSSSSKVQFNVLIRLKNASCLPLYNIMISGMLKSSSSASLVVSGGQCAYILPDHEAWIAAEIAVDSASFCQSSCHYIASVSYQRLLLASNIDSNAEELIKRNIRRTYFELSSNILPSE
jgi:hypothetical protein